MGLGYRSGRQAGFALIEALASLVIISMISMLIFQGVGVGRRVWEGIDNSAATAESIEGAQAILRGRIEQLYPATLYGGDQAEVDIKGEAENFEFLSPPEYGSRPGPLRRFRLEVNVGRQLLLSSISDVVWPKDTGVTQKILLSGVQQVDIEYFGSAAPDFTRRWRQSWYQQIVPPELVRVRVAFEPGDRRTWPDLIVHPLTNIDSACILSAATSHCRGRG